VDDIGWLDLFAGCDETSDTGEKVVGMVAYKHEKNPLKHTTVLPMLYRILTYHRSVDETVEVVALDLNRKATH
jgi:hypothetical protein